MLEMMRRKEASLLLAKEKITDAAAELEEILPDAMEELIWITEHIKEEILTVRSAGVAISDAMTGEEDR